MMGRPVPVSPKDPVPCMRYGAVPVVELTDQAVEPTPTPVADETFVPFMNHMTVLLLVSRHSKSALPVLAPAQLRALHDKETHGSVLRADSGHGDSS
jgi:hypothetical protein